MLVEYSFTTYRKRPSGSTPTEIGKSPADTAAPTLASAPVIGSIE
jgi:hypothetical protein